MQHSVKEKVGQAYGHNPNATTQKKILMIVSNPTVSAQTGWPIGCWAAELTHPYKAFTEAGFEVVLASPEGGKIEFDAYSDPRDESQWSRSDLISMGFIHTPELMALTEQTAQLSTVNPDDFAAIFLVGGQGPMYTFKNNQALMQFFANFYETGKPSAAVCHATTILTDTKLSNGQFLVEGKSWTGFANSEEDIADQAAGVKI
ncbi:MAG: type 1 glutamine amidotransferase domain-containing protein, partial [Bacteroidota bacterium]